MTPQWITDYAQDCRILLGIGDEWQITIHMVNELPDGRDAQVKIDTNYFIADIDLLDNFTDCEASRQAILHEVMHIALSEYAQVVTRLFNHLPKKMRRLAFKLLDDIEEKTIQRMSWGIVRALNPKGENDRERKDNET